MKKSNGHQTAPDLSAKVAQLEAQIAELNNKYLRSLADYQNLEKQTQAWKEDFVKYANSELVGKLLEVLDDLEKAQEHMINDGLRLIIDKLKGILKNSGLEEISVLGADFDPNLMEAVETAPGEEHKVLAVLQKGYKINDRIIRAAKVRVGTIRV